MAKDTSYEKEEKQVMNGRFLSIIEGELDKYAKEGNREIVNVLYNLYVSQRRWLWVLETEYEKDADEYERKQFALAKERRKKFKPERDWHVGWNFGFNYALSELNKDEDVCECKRRKRVAKWLSVNNAKPKKKK